MDYRGLFIRLLKNNEKESDRHTIHFKFREALIH